MRRPACCSDKIRVKKGPWTPEEDIVLVSYIQDHGPGNWVVIPTNTGLMRCNKSCRLRWTNYLRPGIKRGNFTDQEEKIIIHLQQLLGNRWAAIASYLPERTDNDVKNYWNTRLKKKKKLIRTDQVDLTVSKASTHHQPISRGQWERRLQTDFNMAKRDLFEATTTTYALSTENISRLLEGWMKNYPNPSSAGGHSSSASSSSSPDSLVSLLQSESTTPGGPGSETPMPLSLLETWLFDDSTQCQQDHHDLVVDDTAGFF